MPQTEARPWWADVQDVRDVIERRATARQAAPAERRQPETSNRRTVTITGHPTLAPTRAKLVEVERRRPTRRPVERIGHRPDRMAMWAFLFGLLLIVVAAASTAHL